MNFDLYHVISLSMRRFSVRPPGQRSLWLDGSEEGPDQGAGLYPAETHFLLHLEESWGVEATPIGHTHRPRPPAEQVTENL